MSLPHQIPIVRIDPRDGEREVVMARWGLIPFWMKEKPKVPHINARAETVHKLQLFFARHSLTAMSHSRDGGSTSGKSAKMVSNLIASAVKTSNLSPSRVFGNLHDWMEKEGPFHSNDRWGSKPTGWRRT